MSGVEFTLALPPGYRAGPILAYHGRDALSVSERVTGATIAKPVWLEGGPRLVEVDLGQAEDSSLSRARYRIEGPVSEAGRQTLERIVARMLGLKSDPLAFEAMSGAARLIGGRSGLRIPLTANSWEAVCWAVIGQQINLSFAAALRRALIEHLGPVVGASGLRAHPGPAEVAALDPAVLTAMRFSRSKASYLVGMAGLIAAGDLLLDHLATASPVEAEAALCAIRGVGPWTARYIMLRGLGLPDVAPIGDSGLATALQRLLALPDRPDAKQQEIAMRPFAPHRSLATAHLWASLADPA
ncbi:hypothetical protein OSH11_05940 [Kaistia dalseonensis]|uniref:DNA-3-methyladenine glycosylase II n=1 Tax=Kaistia dalseonensis TaxID=410840 RepID=A0ABU0H5S9_9HYPH|nr:hypothetical protein [Kaistia dalseonensis]MCX5494232.1 hypothetical protein [Kaistia dalseonensis]MDQ0436811.1 3-methyladenine DNA glycosylase/8-oxoguanine DNA glycosylase [Kaistia dalseonensis]